MTYNISEKHCDQALRHQSLGPHDGNMRQEMLYLVVGYTRLEEGGPLVMLGWIFVRGSNNSFR